MEIRKATMEDLAAVTAVEAECFPEAEAAKEKDFKARLEDEPKVTLKEGEVNVTLNLSFKNGLNALTLAKEIQKEVTEAFLNMTEYASFKVDVKIGRNN